MIPLKALGHYIRANCYYTEVNDTFNIVHSPQDFGALIPLPVLQWAFGVTCWEVFSLGRSPYPGIDPFSLVKALENGMRLENPSNEACSQEM